MRPIKVKQAAYEDALRESDGDLTEAAEIVGITRQAMHSFVNKERVGHQHEDAPRSNLRLVG